MKHALSLATVIAVSFSLPAFAADYTSAPAVSADSSIAAFTAQLAVRANASQVRKLLAAQNYTNISQLDRDGNGRWTGTAVKNGKATFVSVYLPRKPNTAVTN